MLQERNLIHRINSTGYAGCCDEFTTSIAPAILLRLTLIYHGAQSHLPSAADAILYVYTYSPRYPRAGTSLHNSPEIQNMYSLSLPVSAIRTKIRQEFERHRYVNQLPVVDVLLFQSHSEYQEMLNYWKQLSHVMKYFRVEEDPTAKLPKNFMSRFLEGRN
ncbi:hypothetical protein PAAG_03546 [Paracoccidioides lutzii Pb01]|uniref:NADH-ubiquinone oxidoreductase 14.8 kDa subunit n=1 Tax=Paracoccidioides lutzii (strain ATCC MYA-826 / Pb01) TaxID=502779 RepID=C1GXH2_PARBA|nr:hypothetical protein PAAG_03546 [Paracoccidioides lutzii Pb01]EEH41260.2 hypothetical protein PAAG_03546 [Paracoccidioides lutzii Pb01]